jgi:nitrogen-specific signal transduction histidine kinase
MPINSQNITLNEKQILIVDDDSVILNTVTVMLKNSGMIPMIANSGAEALNHLSVKVPDIILLDYMMPGLNGVEVYKRIQTDPKYEVCRDVPVIMLTAKTDNEAEQIELLKMGMSAYLLKPFGYKELVNIISNVLTLHETKMENIRLHREVDGIKNYLQSIFDSITDIISVQDSDFHIRKHNHAAEVFLGSDRTGEKNFQTHAVKEICHSVYFKRDTVCPQCPALTTMKAQQTGSAEISLDSRYYQISTFPVTGDSASFIEVIKDITERKELERQLMESVKLASVGTLAAGVAHEINNPLSIVLGFAQTMIKEIPEEESLYRDLKIVEQEATRCAKVVKDLLAFARPGRMEKTETHLIELMQSSISLLRHFIRKNVIHLQENYSPAVPKLSVDAKKMQQVFVNILLNAIDAMPRGGKLIVSILPEPQLSKVRIEITDTGAGIADENLDKIFDPFFTTKISKGTGLGLSICRSIIKEHLGSIGVKSKLNQGTTIRIDLPGVQ